jgi:hypothetical protein
LTDAIKRFDFATIVWLIVIRQPRAKGMMKPGRAMRGFDPAQRPQGR